MNLKEGEKPQEKAEGGNVYGLSNGEFIKNVIILSLLFTCFSFSFWLTDFQAEYLGTDIFILFYANGVVCIISGQINLFLYPLMGMKWLIISVQIITLIAASYIVLVQQKYLQYDDPEEENLFVNISIPVALLFMSCSIQVGFTAVVQAAYQDERVLPFAKKATAINIIILVSKSATIGAPFVNEEDEPIPILVIIGLAITSIIIVLFFKSKAELDEMIKVTEKKAIEDAMETPDMEKKEV